MMSNEFFDRTCNGETETIKKGAHLTPYPSMMMVLKNIFKGIKTQVLYLNFMRMMDYMKDGHLSI